MVKSKIRSVFVCQNCGSQRPKPKEKCSDYNSWNSLVDEITSTTSSSSSLGAKSRSWTDGSAGTIVIMGSISGCAIGSGVGVFLFGIGALPDCGVGAAALDGLLLKFSPNNAHLYGAKTDAFSKKAIQFSRTTEQAIRLLEKYLPRSF